MEMYVSVTYQQIRQNRRAVRYGLMANYCVNFQNV